MTTLLDGEANRKKAEKRYALHIVFLILLSLAVIGGDVALLLTSKLNFIPQVIITSLLTALWACLLIFDFLNVFPLDLHYRNFYKGLCRTSLEHHRSLTYEGEKDRKDIHRVSHRCLEFSYIEKQQTFRITLYVLDNDGLSFEAGAKIKADTYHNVLIRYEVIEHATVQ